MKKTTPGGGAAAVPIPAGDSRRIPLDQLVESKTNPRRHYDPRKMEEMTASVRKYGVIQALVVRQISIVGPKERYEIVCGSCRFRAAKKAELEEVLCDVRKYTDEQVLEIQLIENAMRDDLHPLEEAGGFQRLLKMPGYTVAAIAEKIGHDVSHIYRRLAFLKLIPALADLFANDSILAAHAQLLCPLTPADQTLALKDGLWAREEWVAPEDREAGIKPDKKRYPVSPRELSSWIKRHVLLVLNAAPWKWEDKDLVPKAGSCIDCPKRTGFNTALFEGLYDKGERCLDRFCFEDKMLAFLLRVEAAAGRFWKVIRIATAYADSRDVKARSIKLSQHEYSDATKGDCAHIEYGLIAHGPGVGTVMKICRHAKCPVHQRRYGAGGSYKPSFADTWKEKERRLAYEIDELAREETAKELALKSKRDTGGIAINGVEIVAVALRHVDYIDYQRHKAVAAELGIQPKKDGGTRDLQALIRDRLKTMSPREVFQTLVQWSLACEQSMDLLARYRKLDLKKIKAGVGKKLRADFLKKKQAAALAAKKKTAPGKKAKP